MSAQSTQSIPHPYRATGDVSGTRSRDRLGRFRANATKRAINYVIGNWHFCICRELAAN